MEVLNEHSFVEGLNFSEVVVAVMVMALAIESLEVSFRDGEHIFVDKPVDIFCARRCGEGALIVVESRGDFETCFLVNLSFKEFVDVGSVNVPHVFNS